MKYSSILIALPVQTSVRCRFISVDMSACPLLVTLVVLSVPTSLAAGPFGDAFAWGVATSAFQTEGAWNVKGRSISNHFLLSLV